MKLLQRMSNYEVKYLKRDNVTACSKIMDQLEKLRAAQKDAPGMDSFIKSKSEAALGMFSWCRNSLKVYDIWRDVEPKEIRAAKLKEEKVRAEQDLAETQRRLAEITTMLEGLNRKQQLKQEELDDLMDK